MPVMYRISKDYTQFLLQSSNLSEIVSSIINVPWLCLERSDRYYEGKKKPGKNFKHESSPPFLNLSLRENSRATSGPSPLDYFLELDIAHPISDKVYYSIAYSSVLTQHEPLGHNSQTGTLTDTFYIGEARKCFIDRKEIVIPDVTFILHLKLTIPALKKVKQLTCIVYSPHEYAYSQPYSKPSAGEYSITLQLEEECLLTFCFSSFFINTQTETGLAALNSLYPWESKQFLDSLNLHRLFLSHSKCKFFCYEKDARNMALSEIYSDIYQDLNGNGYCSPQTKFNPAQNNPVFGDSLNDCSSDFYSSGKYMESKQGMQATRSRSSGKESDQAELSGLEGEDKAQECQVQENSAQNCDPMLLQDKHTFDQILKSHSLLKHYASSTQKGTLVQEVIGNMSEEVLENSLNYLKQALRDICKSKYGNYIIQIFAQNLSSSRLMELLTLVHLSDVDPAPCDRGYLPP